MSDELPPLQFVGSLLVIAAIIYLYKKIKNPYVQCLLILLALPTVGYAFLWGGLWAMGGSPLASGFPCILVFSYIIFKAIQWQRNKSKNKSEEAD